MFYNKMLKGLWIATFNAGVLFNAFVIHLTINIIWLTMYQESYNIFKNLPFRMVQVSRIY